MLRSRDLARWKALCRAIGRSRLSRDERGAALIEFGFVVIPLAGLLVATLQICLVFFAQQNLETAAEKATRQIMTGQAQQAGMTASGFRSLVCSKLPSFMTCSNVMVDVQTVSSFSSVQNLPTITYDANGNVTNSWSFNPGGAGSINVVRVMYIWNVVASPLGFDLSTMSGSRRLLVATAVIKTEPYK